MARSKRTQRLSWQEWIAHLATGWEFWLTVAGVALLVIGFLLVGEWLTSLLAQADRARAWIRSFGPRAPVVYIGLYIAQIVIAPVPGQFFSVMGGYLFGSFWGMVYSLTGITLGAGVAVSLGRLVGRGLVNRFFDPAQIRHWERRFRARSPLTWAMLFVLPVPDLTYYVAGLSSVSLPSLLFAVVLGRSVGVLLGTTMGNLTSRLPLVWVILQWSLVLVAFLLFYRFQRHIRYAILVGVRKTRRWRRGVGRPGKPAQASSESSRANIL